MEKPKFESAEKKYQLDTYEVKAVEFAYDPIEYLRSYRESLLQDGHNPVTIAWELIDEYESLLFVIESDMELISIQNEDLQKILLVEGGYDSVKIMFHILKQAGVTKNELENWVRAEAGETSEEKLRDRSDGVALQEVFNEQ